jgi:hypothetical protein
MEVCLKFLGHEGAPVIKAMIPDHTFTVGAIVSIILQHKNPSGVTAGQVKIICGGVLLKHSSTLADCLWNPSNPIYYTYPQQLVTPSFLDFSACQTVAEALQAIADAAAATTGSFCPFSMRDSLFQTPLHHACMKFKDAAPVRSLIAAGSDVNALNHDGFSSLFYARSLEVVQELLRNKADPNIVVKGQTPLHRAVSGDVVDILIANGCVLNEDSPLPHAKLSSFTPLHSAASRSADIVCRLIHHKADANARESSGKTPLHFAVDVETAESLLSAKTDIGVRDTRGFTALHFANSATLARWFLRQGLRADGDQSKIPSPIETVPEFETAVVLYEAGESCPRHVFQLGICCKNGAKEDSSVSAAKVRRYHEFQRFNTELALTGLCRGAALATAFGRRALHFTSSLQPSQPCLNILCVSGSVLLPRALACAGGSFRPEDEQGAAGSAGGTAQALHMGRFSDTRRSFSTFRILKGHYLRCTASGGMAGLIVRRLFENSCGVRMSQMHRQHVLRYTASSVLAMALHGTVAST